MKLKQTVVMAVFALACSLALALSAFAVDNGTEFGIEDDLTVLGKEGTAADPDVEIKGFTLIGSSVSAPNIPIEPGNMYINGEVEITSGVYVSGSSTFTARVKLPNAASIFVNDGATGKVLKKDASGSLIWDDDSTGLTSLGTPFYLQMVNQSDDGLVDSKFYQQQIGVSTHVFLNASLTAVGTSSITVQGAFESGGAAIFKNTVDVTGNFNINTNMFQVTASNGNTLIAGTLGVNGNTQLGDDTASWSDQVGINAVPVAGTALKVAGGITSGNYVATFYSGTSLAAWIKKK